MSNGKQTRMRKKREKRGQVDSGSQRACVCKYAANAYAYASYAANTNVYAGYAANANAYANEIERTRMRMQ